MSGVACEPELDQLGDRSATRAAFEKAYSDRFAQKGHDQECLVLLHKLGCLYRDIGEHVLGLDHVTRCFESRSDVLGATHSDTIASMRYIGEYYTFLGSSSAASGTQLLRDAYSHYRNSPVFGPSHEETLRSMADLAENLMITGFPKEALTLMKSRFDCVVSLVPVEKEKADKWYLGKNLGAKKKEVKVESEPDSGKWYPGKHIGRGRPGLNWAASTEHPSTLEARLDYASALLAVGDRKKVDGLNLSEVMHRQMADCGTGSFDTLALMDKYVLVLQKQGNQQEALMFNLECVREKTALLGSDHVSTLKSKFALASSYVLTARWKDLEDLQLERSLKMQEERLGVTHPDAISSRIKLGGLYFEQSHVAKALQLFEQCYEQRCASLGEDHVLTLGLASNIANCLAVLDKPADARAIFERTLHVLTTTVGEESLPAIAVMINLIGIVQNCGELDSADAMARRTHGISERILGETRKILISFGISINYYLYYYFRLLCYAMLCCAFVDPYTLELLSGQCNIYMVRQQWQQACALGEKILAQKAKIYDEYHPSMLSTMENLGQIYKGLGRVGEAIDIGRKVMELRVKYTGSKHHQTITAKATYAISLCEADRAAEALKLINECIIEGKEVLGSEHTTLTEYYQVLGHTYCHLGEFSEALKWTQLALERCTKELGEQHHKTVNYKAKTEWIKSSMTGASNGGGSAGIGAPGMQSKTQPGGTATEVEAIAVDPASQQLILSMQQRASQAEGYAGMQQFDLAAGLYKEVLGNQELLALVDTPVGVAFTLNAHLLNAKTNYALCLFKMNKFDAAVSVLEDILPRLETNDQPPPIEGITMCRQMLEQSYAMLQKPLLTLESMTNNWKYHCSRFGEVSEQAIGVLNGRGMYHFALRDFNSAMSDFTEVMRVLVLLQGASHPDTVGSVQQIAAMFAGVGVVFTYDLK